MPLTEDHLLLLEKQTAGTQYRRVLAELRHRGIDATRQSEMFAEIAEVIGRGITPSQSTISQLLNKRHE